MLTHKTQVQVEWGDCGPTGQVFYPRLFEWVNPSCHDMMDSGGLTLDVLCDHYQVRGVMLKSVNMELEQPACLGDKIDIASEISKIGKTSFTITHRATRDGEVIFTGDETRLWVLVDPDDPEKFYRDRIPDDVRAILEGRQVHSHLS